MLQTLKLLLPALIPSWRFFDVIAASPRLEYTQLNKPEGTPTAWQEFCPRPPHLSPTQMLQRMFWNPRWNEFLYLVSCAERLVNNACAHSQQEILKRIRRGLAEEGMAHKPFLQYRLSFISRSGDTLETHVDYVSPVYPIEESAAP